MRASTKNAFLNYHIKMLLGDFNAKICREEIFKQIIGDEILHEISNDNVVRVVNFAYIQKFYTS
jgi:hypothetical protein